MSDLLTNPQHWRNRAEEARAQAAQMNDKAAEDAMLRVAREYDRLAELAQARVRAEKKPVAK